MEKIGSSSIFATNNRPVEQFSKETSQLLPLLFNHDDLVQALDSSDLVDREKLTNTINYIHFMDAHILVLLRHKRYKKIIVAKSYPESCLGKHLTCRWSAKHFSSNSLTDYHVLNLIIDDGRTVILVPPVLKTIDQNGIELELPETSYSLAQRRVRRYPCQDISGEFVQAGLHAACELIDFSPIGFRVQFAPEFSDGLSRLNPGGRAIIHLHKGGRLIFSGACKCIRQDKKYEIVELVLAPEAEEILRFKTKQIRNPRRNLVPTPIFKFDHPFYQKRIELEITDLSTSGFAVAEQANERCLMPGMVIHDAVIEYAGVLKMKCQTQVIYQEAESDEKIRLGIAVVDIDISTFTQLNHLLMNSVDPSAHISTEVVPERLWEFFFNTGFIYPTKYDQIKNYKEAFKEMYLTLYNDNLDIARHFTYQKNGKIDGHISMVRAYERTWMIHHHAARASNGKRTGFMVLKQLMHYLNDMNRFPSTDIDHVMCYFRPENKFPRVVFGGFAKTLKNPKACSMDLFSYVSYPGLSVGTTLPKGWTLRECTPFDHWELAQFYNYLSGGLMVDALFSGRVEPECTPLEEMYKKSGFVRRWETYALSHQNEVYAVFIVNRSNLGLNLSELINGVKVIVTKSERLPWSTLSIGVAQLTGTFNRERVPILIYPFDYVQAQHIPYDKKYQLWIMDVSYGSEYITYVQKKFKMAYH